MFAEDFLSFLVFFFLLFFGSGIQGMTEKEFFAEHSI